jgi:hypothetical protein
MKKEEPCTAPFEHLVLDVKVCGTDGRTGNTAVLLLFMDRYTGIVFHSTYTTQTGRSVIVKFLRYICNKYNFDNLNIDFKLITSLDEPFFPIIESFLPNATEIIYNPTLSNELCDKVRQKYVNYGV